MLHNHGIEYKGTMDNMFFEDYSEMSLAYRPSHADATYDFKYGVRSVQGGGRSSARETIGRVAAGAVAKKVLKIKAGTEWSSTSVMKYHRTGKHVEICLKMAKWGLRAMSRTVQILASAIWSGVSLPMGHAALD
eukprot:Gb_32919 [translate_table: standard]